MASEPRTVNSSSNQLKLRRLEMQLESEELTHKRNLCVLEINRIRQERILNEEMDMEKKIEKIKAKRREKESQKEKKKIEKENRKMEKENRKLEREREKDMGKKGGYKPRASFCWTFWLGS